MKIESVRVELPGDRLYGEECQVTTLTLADASALSLLPKTQDTKKVYQIIDNRINLDVKKLTLPDFWFLLYWQRINSYPSFPVKLPWKCPHCDTKNIDELSGSKLVIDDLASDYSPKSVDEGMTIPTSAGDLLIRVKLAGDELQVQNYLRVNNTIEMTPETYEELMIACMFEPNGGNLKERFELVHSKLNAEDHMVIKAFEEMFDFGVKSYSEFTCYECKEVSKVAFDFNLTNFFPSISDTQDLRARILSSQRTAPASRQDSGNGLREGSVHPEDSRHIHKDSEAAERSENSTDEDQETIEMTPEQLQSMIEQEVAKVRKLDNTTEKEVEFDKVKER